jgi:hypothetical protein
MRRILALPLVMVLSGCLPTRAVAPAPLSFHASRPPNEATQVAAVALINAGFRVTQTDSIGQALTASRTATHGGNEQYVTCNLSKGSAAAANSETTLTIEFRATPGPSGSDVRVESRVRTSYPGYAVTSMETAPNDTDCVSNGAMEQQLAAALR